MYPVGVEVGVDLPEDVNVSVAGDLGDLIYDKACLKQAAGPFAAQIVPAQIIDTKLCSDPLETGGDALAVVGEDAIISSGLTLEDLPGFTQQGHQHMVPYFLSRVFTVFNQHGPVLLIYARPLDLAHLANPHATQDGEVEQSGVGDLGHAVTLPFFQPLDDPFQFIAHRTAGALLGFSNQFQVVEGLTGFQDELVIDRDIEDGVGGCKDRTKVADVVGNCGRRCSRISSGLAVIDKVLDGELVSIELGDIAIGYKVKAVGLGSAYGWADGWMGTVERNKLTDSGDGLHLAWQTISLDHRYHLHSPTLGVGLSAKGSGFSVYYLFAFMFPDGTAIA